jgi:hypothetical protein
MLQAYPAHASPQRVIALTIGQACMRAYANNGSSATAYSGMASTYSVAESRANGKELFSHFAKKSRRRFTICD